MRSFGAMVLATMLAGGAVPARAQADATCTRQAKSTYAACRAQCKDDFLSARFTCKGVDPACGKACLAGRQVCSDAIDAILETGQVPGGATLANCPTGTDGCKAALQTAKQVCGAPCNANPVCDACVDAAQVLAFQCRDTCRESWRADAAVQALRQQCKATFQACVKACPTL
ncbi:MAG: hypothetical protein U0807_06065 [Candidatus Binatia bacterium]